MAASATATEREAITETVGLYIDGVAKGDVAKLKQAFHEQSWMFGSMGGERLDMPIGEMFKLVEQQPMDIGGSYRANVTSVEQVGDAATATVEESGCWGSVSFVDFFLLSRIDGTWKIVGKTFAHTGGDMPTG
jgi:hypothetical protein